MAIGSSAKKLSRSRRVRAAALALATTSTVAVRLLKRRAASASGSTSYGRMVPPAWVVGASLVLLTGRWALANDRSRVIDAPPDPAVHVQDVVNRLRLSLAIPHDVLVELVDENPLMASVHPIADKKGVFLLSIQRGFLDTLAGEELEAIVAHELGHVWIYTHHPYLQTEQLANRIAMRLVSREQLAQVYQKIWGAGAMKTDLAGFLGVAAPAADTAQAANTPAASTPANTPAAATPGAPSPAVRLVASPKE